MRWTEEERAALFRKLGSRSDEEARDAASLLIFEARAIVAAGGDPAAIMTTRSLEIEGAKRIARRAA